MNTNKNKLYEAIMRDCTEPDEELIQKTLAAMSQRRKAKERKHVLQNKAVKRMLATAALVAVMVTTTPLGGCVVSASENTYGAFHNWIEDVFHLEVRKGKNGITANIIESRVVNDTLYLAIDVNCVEYLAAHPRNTDSFVLDIAGSITDNKGSKVSFTNENTALPVVDPHNALATSNRYKRDYPSGRVAEYMIYIPDLHKLMNTKEKTYRCDLTMRVQAFGDDGKDKTIAELGQYSFAIENIDSVVSAKAYDLTYSYSLQDLRFDFRKMIVGPIQADILVELTPTNQKMADIMAAWFHHDDERSIYHGNDDTFRWFYAHASVYCPTEQQPYYSQYEDGDWVYNDVIFENESTIFKRGSKYYMLMTYTTDEEYQIHYDYERMVNLSSDDVFKVSCLYYNFKFGQYGSDVEYEKYEENIELFLDDDEPALVYQEIDTKGTQKISPEEEPVTVTFRSEAGAAVTVGVFADSLYLADIRHEGRSVYSDSQYANEHSSVLEGRFVRKRNGKIAIVYDECEIDYTSDDDGEYTYIYFVTTDDNQDEFSEDAASDETDLDDELEFDYLIYNVYDDDGNGTQYILTNPAYKTAAQWQVEKEAERETLKKQQEAFEANSTFTVG